MPTDDVYMTEAATLAEQGLGAVEPNPMVGALIVRDGRIIGRGWHRGFGGPHAEVEAIADARAAGHDVTGATMYVTLEPCCHQGKTPPCTRAIIEARIARVVVGMGDPDQRVCGKGLAELQAAGVQVDVGICEPMIRQLLAPYVKLRTAGRPWVICKWAQTLDGRVATRTGHSRWISGEPARQRVHVLRGQCDGVAVGIGTVLADDPLLTNRSGMGKQPTRVVLDERLELDADSRLIRTARESPVLLVTAAEAARDKAGRAERLVQLGAEVLTVPTGLGGLSLPDLLDELGRRNWTRLLVEGGPTVMGSILRQGLADELLVFVAPRLLGGREARPSLLWDEPDRMDQAMGLPSPSVEFVGDDLLLRFHLHTR